MSSIENKQQALENLVARDYSTKFCGTAELMKECLGECDTMLETLYNSVYIGSEPTQIECHKVGRLVLAAIKQQLIIRAEQELIDYPLEETGIDWDEIGKQQRLEARS